MEHTLSPAEIDFGTISEIRYQPDFGRYEAAVVLRLKALGDGPQDIRILTSVPARLAESQTALRRRLVLDAARLWRMSEAGLARPDTQRLAA